MKIFLVGAGGYIGGFLHRYLIEMGHEVLGRDLQPSRDASQTLNWIQLNYRDLTDQQLSDFEVCLWLAGHSSVQICQREPDLAVENNVLDLFGFARRLHRLRILFIYASSGSVHSSFDGGTSFIASEFVQKPYDASKIAFDSLLRGTETPGVALRFGTLSGPSPFMRWELVFNSMVRSAVLTREVWVGNGENFRSIIFLDHLATIVDRLLKKIESSQIGDKIIAIPLCSRSGTIAQLGNTIAESPGASINFLSMDNSYSSVLSTKLSNQILGTIAAPPIGLQIGNLASHTGQA